MDSIHFINTSSVYYTYMQSLVRGEDLPLDTVTDAIVAQRKKHLLLQEEHQASLGGLIIMIKKIKQK